MLKWKENRSFARMSQVADRRRTLFEKILEFPAARAACLRGQKITQRDLIEERLLTNEAAKAVAELKAKRNEIRRKLEVGAPVESGNHSARLSARHTRHGDIFFTLVVR